MKRGVKMKMKMKKKKKKKKKRGRLGVRQLEKESTSLATPYGCSKYEVNSSSGSKNDF